MNYLKSYLIQRLCTKRKGFKSGLYIDVQYILMNRIQYISGIIFDREKNLRATIKTAFYFSCTLK